MSDKPKTIEEQLATAQAELTNANARITTLEGENTQAKADLQTEKDAHATTKGELTKAQGQVTELQSKVTTLESEAKTAGTRAAEIVGSLGTPNPAPRVDPTAGAKTLTEQYAAIKDPQEKTAFYRKHKAALHAEAKKQEAK